MPLFLPARITGEQVAQRLSRRRLANLYGLFLRPVNVARPNASETRTLPFVERIWLPAYAVTLHAVSSKGEKNVCVSVDGISGECSIFECENDLVPMESEEECFPPSLQEPAAVEFARKGLLRYVMAQRGQMNKPTVDAVQEVRFYYFAAWIYYFRRRRKYIDLKVFDAYTGKSAGAKMRVSVVNALVAARKRKRQSPK